MKIRTTFAGSAGRPPLQPPHAELRSRIVTILGVICIGLLNINDVPAAVEVRPEKTILVSQEWLQSAEYSPNSQIVAVGGYDQTFLVDSKSKAVVSTVECGGGQIQAIRFLSNQCCIAGGYRKLFVIDAESGTVLSQHKVAQGQITAIEILSAASGKFVLSADDGTLGFWTLKDESLTKVHEEQFSDPIQGLAYSENHNQLALAFGDIDRPARAGFAQLYQLESKTPGPKFDGHTKAAIAVTFAGDRLLTTSVDGRVIVFSLSDQTPLGFYGKHSRSVNGIIAVDDTAFSVGGGGAKGKNELHVWNIPDGETLFGVEPHKQRVNAVALSPDRSELVTAAHDGHVTFYAVKGLPSPKSVAVAKATPDKKSQVIRVGIIGLDTSHATAFTKMLNAETPADDLAGCRVVAAYPNGSADIESSVSRIPKYTDTVKSMGVEIVDSIDELLEKVDVVLLETNDGRPHLKQLIPCLRAGKRVFIDKPIAASLTDTIAIFQAAKQFDVPIFSASSLRFSKGIQDVRNGSAGDVLGCNAWSPCTLESTHPDLFWYGIHGVETLFTAMKTGCQSVVRVQTADGELVTGTWKDGRIGTFRGIRSGKKGYGGTVFGSKGIQDVGKYGGYRPLLVEIVKFFRTGKVPVAAEETIEIYAFMEAADESKRRGFTPVLISDVMKKATQQATDRLEELKVQPAK